MQWYRRLRYIKFSTAKSVFFGYQKTIVVLLFMMSMNTWNRMYYFPFIAAIVCAVMQPRSLKLPRALIPTLAFSLSLFLFSPEASKSALGLIKQFTYPLCTLIGYNLISSKKTDFAEKQAVRLTVLLACGSCIHYFLNMLNNWGGTIHRNTIDIWTNTVVSATGQAILACLMIAVASAYLFIDCSRGMKLGMIAVLCGIVYYNFTLAGRTIFALLGIALCVAFIAKFLTMHNSMKRFILLVFTAVMVVFFVGLIYVDFMGVQDAITESNFYRRFFADNAVEVLNEDSRWSRKLMYLERFEESFWGGGHLWEEIGFAHDILLDTYDEAGIFALVSILFVLIDMIKKCFVICKSKKILASTKILLSCVIIVVMSQFMVEPILIGAAWLLADYCVLYGAYTRLVEMA